MENKEKPTISEREGKFQIGVWDNVGKDKKPFKSCRLTFKKLKKDGDKNNSEDYEEIKIDFFGNDVKDLMTTAMKVYNKL